LTYNSGLVQSSLVVGSNVEAIPSWSAKRAVRSVAGAGTTTLTIPAGKEWLLLSFVATGTGATVKNIRINDGTSNDYVAYLTTAGSQSGVLNRVLVATNTITLARGSSYDYVEVAYIERDV